ncbi:hypothetical protein HF1_10580 [Mycoplasma haemofelis str. Langford 1]|uniref:Uncharacterized protein n=1 Tax=Mycoplasma haemofelis (strain Langford 1) TaxID=941640 RepID=E8ZIU5_MYCHL|nr:hypothetical protein [Mycoplasma haemofelis]CBY93066.1 hypothetical protein HF1_10580 [Mycoplasma haemofelis str. Langford 1]
MSNLAFLKVLCGGAATAGTVGVGSFLISDTSSEDSLATKKVKFEVQEQLEEPEVEEEVSTEKEMIPEEPAKVPETISKPSAPIIPPKCTFYIVEEPKGSGKDRIVTKILEKVTKDQKSFLSGKGTQFEKDVKGACPEAMDNSKNVYVWKDYWGYWIYAGDISTQDWLLKEGVEIPAALKTNSGGRAS